jgi:hypothetical protein
MGVGEHSGYPQHGFGALKFHLCLHELNCGGILWPPKLLGASGKTFWLCFWVIACYLWIEISRSPSSEIDHETVVSWHPPFHSFVNPSLALWIFQYYWETALVLWCGRPLHFHKLGMFRGDPSIHREVGTNRPGQVGQSCSVVFSALPDDSILRAVTNELLPALQSQGGGGKMQVLGLDILYDSPIQQQPSRGSWHVEAQGIHHMMLHTLLWTLAMGEAFENINITYAYVDFEGCLQCHVSFSSQSNLKS